MKKGILAITEGIDGSGNGEIIKGLAEWATKKGFKVFDLAEYEKEKKTLPSFDEIKDFGYKVILCAEMGYAWVGAALREELVRKIPDYSYDAVSVAYAYSLDREIRFKRLLGPFLKSGGIVFQQRSFISSIVYQPVQAANRGERLSVEDILYIPGNRFVYDNYCPDILFITKCDAKTALERIARRKKNDNCIFEKLGFQREIEGIYSSKWLRELVEKKGTSVHYIDTNEPKTPEDTRDAVNAIIEKYYSGI